MARVNIPAALVDLVKERRLIPFVGAGFSASLELPMWKDLLEKASEEVDDDLKFSDVVDSCGGDLLQVAEYYFIKCDRRIGPLRYQMSLALTNVKSPINSSSHVELVNLNPPQIYTTNYDDLIEKTFRGLNAKYGTIVLPRDIATANALHTQVIKYHGDLRHDATLVLTESSYYKRLDFESPMDLKFRSDLLGKSVLFMGYSFRDINIRVVWFKLMEMMRDISKEDRLPSYIVRFEKNQVLDTLFAEVGLETIVLDNESVGNYSDRMADFLAQLCIQSSTNAYRLGSTDHMYLTSRLLKRYATERTLKVHNRRPRSVILSRNRLEYEFSTHIENRSLPQELLGEAKECLTEINNIIRFKSMSYVTNSRSNRVDSSLATKILSKDIKFAPAIRVLFSGLLFSDARDKILDTHAEMVGILSRDIELSEDMGAIAGRLENEIEFHESSEQSDADLAYVIYLIINAFGEDQIKNHEQMSELLGNAQELYPSICELREGNVCSLNDLQSLLDEIEERANEEEEDDDD